MYYNNPVNNTIVPRLDVVPYTLYICDVHQWSVYWISFPSSWKLLLTVGLGLGCLLTLESPLCSPCAQTAVWAQFLFPHHRDFSLIPTLIITVYPFTTGWQQKLILQHQTVWWWRTWFLNFLHFIWRLCISY